MRAEVPIAVALIILILIPLLSYFSIFTIRAVIESPRGIKGDDAVVEIYTLHALKGSQLLGPYSRYRWNNLGPAYFYFLAPFYLLLGKASSAIKAGAVLINLLSVLAAMAVAWRHMGFRRFYVLAPLTGVYLFHLGGAIKSPWNPYATLLPFTLLLFVSAALATRHKWALPLQALLSSFVVQTHIMYLPVTMAITGAALLISWVGGRGNQGAERGKWWPWWLAAGLILALMWAPAILEEASNSPGNVSKVVAFFTKAGQSQGLAPTLLSVSENFLGPIATVIKLAARGLNPTIVQLLMTTLFILILAIGGWAWALEVRRKQYFNAALLLLCGVAVIVSILAVSQIVGELYEHLVLWTTALGFVTIASIAGAFLAPLFNQRRTKRRAWIGPSLAVVLTILVSGWTTLGIRQGIMNVQEVPRLIRAMAAPLLEYMKGKQASKFKIKIADDKIWPEAAGIILYLYKNGLDFSIEEDWLFMFGRQFAPTGTEPKDILLTDVKTYKKLSNQQGYIAIITEGPIRALEAPLNP